MRDDNFPTIISFYTPNWEYKQYAEKMKANCKKFRLHEYIMERETTGDWIKNTSMKPAFILEAIQEVKRPVLWIDVDGSLLRKPALLRLDKYPYDFAARPMPPHRTRKWHVGTMFFNYNEVTLKFIEAWYYKTEALGKGTDERALDILWKENHESIQNLKVAELPKEYFEMLRKLNDAPSTATVICHRASKDPQKLQMKQRHEIK